jgi:hypothetical protein
MQNQGVDSTQPVPEAPEGQVERFNPFIDELDSLVPDPGMIEVTDGGWVRYEDYEKVMAESQELKALVKEKDMEIQFLTDELSRIEYQGTSQE